MSRLPKPGADDNTWGNILNDFLSAAHNPDGSLKPGLITATNLTDNAVTDAKVATNAAIQQSKVQDLTTDLSARAPLDNPSFTGAVTVPAPANSTDAATKAYVDATASAGTPDATATTRGKIQLTGDLAGTAASPTVPGLASKAADNTVIHKTDFTAKGELLAATAAGTYANLSLGADAQVLTADSTQATGIKWAPAPSAPVSSVAGKTGVVTLTAADVSAVPTTDKGAANGVATLDASIKIPIAQLPDLSGTYALSSLTAKFGLTAGQGLAGYDDFQRPDGPLANTLAPSGQRYIHGFTSQNASISGKRFIRNVPGGYGGDGSAGADGSAALFLPLTTVPTKLACSFIFTTAGTTTTNDCVLACGAVGLVPAVQLACRQTDWLLFVPHGSPLVYTTIGSGTFATPLVADNATVYTSMMEVDLPNSAVKITLPDGSAPFTLSDPLIAASWGSVVIIQSRREVSTDGDSAFTSFAAAPYAPPRPPLPQQPTGALAAMTFPGDGTSYVQSNQVTWKPSGDLTLTAEIAPKTVASGAGHAILSEWSTGIRSFIFNLNASGELSLTTSPDGTASVSDTASVALPVPDATFITVQVRRKGNDGSGNRVTTFWTSIDRGVTWTQLGSTRTVAGGASGIFESDDSFLAGIIPTSGQPFSGQIRSVSIVDPSIPIPGPITIVASTGVFTTTSPHNMLPGSIFVPGAVTTTTGITAGNTYYVASVPSTTTFTLSSTADGQTPLVLIGNGSVASSIGSVIIGSLDNTVPWSVYAGTPGSYTGMAGNSWFASGSTQALLGWKWTIPVSQPTLPTNPAGTTTALRLPGDGSYISTVAPAQAVTSGVLELKALITPDMWGGNAGSDQCIAAQWQASGSQRAWALYLLTSKKLELLISGDGATYTTLSCGTAISAADGSPLGLRAVVTLNDGAGHMTAQFYTSTDGGTSWIVLGSLVSVALPATPGLFASTAPLQVGIRDSSAIPFKGSVSWFEARDGVGGTLIGRLDNTTPWFYYQGTSGIFIDSAATPNAWKTTSVTATWVFTLPVAATPPSQHIQTVVASGTFIVPAGVTIMRIIIGAAGGGGGGGGAAALTGGVASQVGGGGGAAGGISDQTIAVTSGQTLTHTIGNAAPASTGGAASGGATGNAGTTGAQGSNTTVTGTGVNIIAYGGGGGNGGGANTITSAGGGLTGIASIFSSATNYGQAGAGGYTTTATRRSSPPWAAGASGGQAGECANTTNGGAGGLAGLMGGENTAVVSQGTAPTTTGTVGIDAASNTSAGGGGGGGGAPGGAGGGGGKGGSGFVSYVWIS